MAATLTLLRRDRPARLFFIAYTQSALGTGAGYVAVLTLAYARWRSPWAVPLALIAETVPIMLLGPILGAVADRAPRRTCLIASNVLSTIAFAGITAVPSLPAMLAFIVVAGAGFGLFNASALAALPALAAPERQPTATALYSAIGEAGYILGPVLAVPLLVAGGGETLAAANAVTFGVSALLLFGLPRVRSAPGEPAVRGASLLRQARDGLSAAWRIPGVAALMSATTIAVLAFGAMNAGELLLVRSGLHAGNGAFSVLVAASGLGVIVGSLAAGGAGGDALFRRRYLLGLAMAAAGLAAAGLAPDVPAAAAAFLLAGAGNGYAVSSERVLLQRWVPDELRARVFGAKHAMVSTSMMASYALTGAILVVVDVRTVFVGAGAAGLLATATAMKLLGGAPASRRTSISPRYSGAD